MESKTKSEQSVLPELEAILFSAGRALSVKQLSKLTAHPAQEVGQSLRKLADDYAEQKRGLALMHKDNKVQLVSSPSQSKYVEQFVKQEFMGALSRAALETLAIVAYRGPITKPDIDTLRGVNSAIMLRTLLVRGLVERKKDKKDGRTFVYTLTFDFMRELGITGLEQLPDYSDLHHHELIEKFAQTAKGDSIEGKTSDS